MPVPNAPHCQPLCQSHRQPPSTCTPEQAAARIRAAQPQRRATPARVRVYCLLAAASGPLTHQEVETALLTGGPGNSGSSENPAAPEAGIGIDRVTLYRTLDWLVAAGLAQRRADARRVYRYSLAESGTHQEHAHFCCEHCGGRYCLEIPAPSAPPLPAGFVVSHLELDLRGCCAACAPRQPLPTPRP